MKLKRRRKLITFFNILDQPLRFNPFVFSRTFLLWALLGLLGGLIDGMYWISLEFLTASLATFQGWLVAARSQGLLSIFSAIRAKSI